LNQNEKQTFKEEALKLKPFRVTYESQEEIDATHSTRMLCGCLPLTANVRKYPASVLTLYRQAIPFGNRKKYFCGSSQFSIVSI